MTSSCHNVTESRVIMSLYGWEGWYAGNYQDAFLMSRSDLVNINLPPCLSYPGREKSNKGFPGLVFV